MLPPVFINIFICSYILALRYINVKAGIIPSITAYHKNLWWNIADMSAKINFIKGNCIKIDIIIVIVVGQSTFLQMISIKNGIPTARNLLTK